MDTCGQTSAHRVKGDHCARPAGKNFLKYKIRAHSGCILRFMERLLRIQDVETAVGMRRANIYRLIRQGEFPKQVAVGERAVRWKESEVDAWIAGRPEKS